MTSKKQTAEEWFQLQIDMIDMIRAEEREKFSKETREKQKCTCDAWVKAKSRLIQRETAEKIFEEQIENVYNALDDLCQLGDLNDKDMKARAIQDFLDKQRGQWLK